jgi:hypothetical protein
MISKLGCRESMPDAVMTHMSRSSSYMTRAMDGLTWTYLAEMSV